MILTPDQRLRVFLSSTLDELAVERKAAREAVESLKLIPVMFELGARPHPPRSLYRSYLDQSDVFVGIYWQRYGWVAPEMDVSGLEDEFDLSDGMPRLIYIKASDEREPDLQTLLDKIKSRGGVSYKRFETAEELEALIRDDLVLLLTERFHEGDRADEDEASEQVSRLPIELTSFIGRGRELRSLMAHLLRDDVRLTTLTGPGGIGKTRLAIELAKEAKTAFERVHFVPLAPIRDRDLVPEEIAKGLGLHRFDSSTALDEVCEFLGSKRDLLILDNFEQVLGAADVIAHLLGACEFLKILVTSRGPLRLRGEYEFYVGQLSCVPRSDEARGIEDCDAVKLFLERARALRSDFELTDQNARTIAEICARLDGLPLAIELAAARMRMLSPELLLEKLDERLEFLSEGSRDMPDRHRKLRDTISWSYELLDEEARTLLARLGIFRGGFTLEAVEAICGSDGLDVLGNLSDLIDQSLVRNGIVGQGEPRFMILETIREYAWELLRTRPEREEMIKRHAYYYGELTRASGIAGRTDRQVAAFDRLERELFNTRAAAAWLLRNGHADIVADALWESWWVWWTRGYVRDGRRWAERALEYRDDLTDLGYAQLRGVVGIMAFWLNDMATALVALEEAAQLFRIHEKDRGLAVCDVLLGIIAAFGGDVTGGQQRLRGAIAVFERAGDRAGAASAFNALCWTHTLMRTFTGHEEDFLVARRLSEEVGTAMDLGMSKSSLGLYRFYEDGNEEEGVALMLAALDDLVKVRHLGVTTSVLDDLAHVGLMRGQAANALTLLSAAEAIRVGVGLGLPLPAAEKNELTRREASEQLTPADIEAAVERGRYLDFDAAVAFAAETMQPVTV